MHVIEVDGVKRRFDPHCHTKFLAGVAYPTPDPIRAKVGEKGNLEESAGKQTALKMNAGCKALGDKCEWAEHEASTTCVECKKEMHVMCGIKVDDGNELEGEALFKCKSCSSSNAL